jgi:hypothetical protein
MSQIKNLLLYLIVLVSCSDEINLAEINFGNDKLTYEIAIDGFISNEYARCRVIVSNPVSVTEEIKRVPVVDAGIVLKHGNDIFLFEHDTNGIYYSIDSIAAIAGEKYILEVVYNGKTYTAEEIVPDEPNDEFYIPFSYSPKYDDSQNPRPLPYDSSSVSLGIPVHNFGYERTNIWGYEMPHFFSDTFPKLTIYHFLILPVYTHKGNIPQGIFPATFGSLGAYGAASDSIEILKAEISEGYNKLLLDMFNETDWQGGMFSTVPGNVSTNLSEGALGYFYALNVKRKRFVIGDFDGHD